MLTGCVQPVDIDGMLVQVPPELPGSWITMYKRQPSAEEEQPLHSSSSGSSEHATTSLVTQLSEVQQQLAEAHAHMALQEEANQQLTRQLQQMTADRDAERRRGNTATAAAGDAQEQLGYVQQALEASRDEVYSLQAACLELQTARAEAEEAAAAAVARLGAAADQFKRQQRELTRWLVAATEEIDMARAAAEAAGRGEAAVLVVMATLSQQHADNKQALQQTREQLGAARAQAADLGRELQQTLSHNQVLADKAAAAEAAKDTAVGDLDRTVLRYKCLEAEALCLAGSMSNLEASYNSSMASLQKWSDEVIARLEEEVRELRADSLCRLQRIPREAGCTTG
jgi:chromosome segregation ATPase